MKETVLLPPAFQHINLIDSPVFRKTGSLCAYNMGSGEAFITELPQAK